MPGRSADDDSCFAVIFTSRLRAPDPGYGDMAEKMLALASEQPGFLGFESARGDGDSELGISISYWRDRDSILAWRGHVEHLVAQKLGRERWYAYYRLRVAQVERDYEWSCDGPPINSDHVPG
jgi:heme-degrading monooxygenase HmoA